MAKSYVPHEVSVVCTEMQSPEPGKLVRERQSPFVFYRKENKPLLTIADKKLEAKLECKIGMKFWGGLQMLCAGLAVAALAIAVVATGGLALVAVAVGAAAVSAGSGIAALWTTYNKHSCDITLESRWILENDYVNFEGHKALLQDSVLMCNKGGAVSLIMDESLAYSLAQVISKNNKEEVLTHSVSQLFQGGITGGTSLTPVGVLVAAPLSIGFYVKGENAKQDLRAQNLEAFFRGQAQKEETLGDQLLGTAKQEGISTPAGVVGGIVEEGITVTATNQALNQQVRELGALTLQRELAGDTAGATSARLGQDIALRSYADFSWKKVFDPKGLGLGLGGAVVNFLIEYGANEKEDGLFDSSIDEMDKIKQRDSNIGINSHIR